jgi:dihydropteroate synthase
MTQRTLLRPTAFIDSPFDRDGQCARLAGGMLWFSAVERIRHDGTRRTATSLHPVAGFEAESDDEARQWAAIQAPRAALAMGARTVRLDQPQLMGIVNATPDSFSDGGAHDDPAAHGMALAEAGAAIVDVGGESTRPGAKPVWEGEETGRVVPVIERLAAAGVAVSVDTRKAPVMEAAAAAGARMINDVSALGFDERSLPTAAALGLPVVLMHSQGDPLTMQDDPRYTDVLVEVWLHLEARIAAADAAGIARERICIDPGIGFGKSVQHNLALLNGLSAFHALGCPLVVGSSRKRMIGALSRSEPADGRLAGSVALALKAADQGAQLHRVHDVADTAQAMKVWRGLRDQALTPQV